MPQDAFTLRYLCIELNAIFSGGKVNRIVQPSNDEVVFTVYTGKRTERLLLDVNPASPRIGVIKTDKDSPLTAPNFCMLLRKHLLSATIDKIELVGFDRIVRIDFTASQEFFDAGKKTLYIELMGRYSNIILTENGRILGGNRGINLFDNGVRPLIVGKPYVFPPVQDKLLPWDNGVAERLKETGDKTVPEHICRTVQGLAASTAEEIIIAYCNKNGMTAEVFERDFKNLAEDFSAFMGNFLTDIIPAPCVGQRNGQVLDVYVFPYSKATGELKKFDALWEAEEYYYTNKNYLKRFTDKKERLKNILNSAIKKAKKRITAISAKQKDAEKLEENRIKGELLIANIYRIKDGQSAVVLENYYDDNKPVEIELDTRKSVSGNAESYYKKYGKQKRTLISLAPQREQAEAELKYLESVCDEVALAETLDELEFVAAEMADYGLINKTNNRPAKRKEETSACREYYMDGLKVCAGRNNAENDKLTASAGKEDLWLHAKDYNSSHVIIVTGGKTVPEKTIVKAAEICAYYSKGRDGGKTEIVYTLKKNVKKPRGGKLGFCTYENYKSLTVAPDKHEEFLKSD